MQRYAKLNLGIGELGKGCLHKGIVTCSNLVMQFFGSSVCCNSFCTTFQADQGTPLERAFVKVQTRCSLASLGSLDSMMFCISDVNDLKILKKQIFRCTLIHTNCRRYRSARTLHSAEQTSCFQSLKACTSKKSESITQCLWFLRFPFWRDFATLYQSSAFFMLCHSVLFVSKLLSIGARLCRCRLRSDSNCCAWRRNTSKRAWVKTQVLPRIWDACRDMIDSYCHLICVFFIISRNMLSMCCTCI